MLKIEIDGVGPGIDPRAHGDHSVNEPEKDAPADDDEATEDKPSETSTDNEKPGGDKAGIPSETEVEPAPSPDISLPPTKHKPDITDTTFEEDEASHKPPREPSSIEKHKETGSNITQGIKFFDNNKTTEDSISNPHKQTLPPQPQRVGNIIGKSFQGSRVTDQEEKSSDATHPFRGNQIPGLREQTFVRFPGFFSVQPNIHNFVASRNLPYNGNLLALGLIEEVGPLSRWGLYGQRTGWGLSKELVSLSMDLMPFISSIKGIIEFTLGKDILTGKPIDRYEAIIGIIIGMIAGGVIKLGAAGIVKLKKFKKLKNILEDSRKVLDENDKDVISEAFNKIDNSSNSLTNDLMKLDKMSLADPNLRSIGKVWEQALEHAKTLKPGKNLQNKLREVRNLYNAGDIEKARALYKETGGEFYGATRRKFWNFMDPQKNPDAVDLLKSYGFIPGKKGNAFRLDEEQVRFIIDTTKPRSGGAASFDHMLKQKDFVLEELMRLNDDELGKAFFEHFVGKDNLRIMPFLKNQLRESLKKTLRNVINENELPQFYR